MTTFTAGWDPGSERHRAVCAWLTENGFDINVVPMDAFVNIEGDQLTVDVYDEHKRLTQRTVTLIAGPSALVRGEE